MFRGLKKKEAEKKDDAIPLNIRSVAASTVFENCTGQIVSATILASKIYYLTLNHFLTGNRKTLKELHVDVYGLIKQTKVLKNNSFNVIAQLQDKTPKLSQYYVQVTETVRKTGNSVFHTYKTVSEYLDNTHTPFTEALTAELTELNDEMALFYNMILHSLKNNKYENIPKDIRKRKIRLLALIDVFQRRQLKRVKRREMSIRNGVLYLNILTETKNLILSATSLVKASRNFYQMM